jgi:hypothetical protein
MIAGRHSKEGPCHRCHRCLWGCRAHAGMRLAQFRPGCVRIPQLLHQHIASTTFCKFCIDNDICIDNDRDQSLGAAIFAALTAHVAMCIACSLRFDGGDPSARCCGGRHPRVVGHHSSARPRAGRESEGILPASPPRSPLFVLKAHCYAELMSKHRGRAACSHRRRGMRQGLV